MKIETYKIELHNIHLYAYHGVIPQENVVGAWYTVNLSTTVDNTECIATDDIDSTVSYVEIYDIVCREMKINSQLLEHVAGRIISSIFENFDSISEIEISVIKETPPLGGDGMSSCVKIKASR